MEPKNPAIANKQGALKPKTVVEAYTFRKDGFPRIRKAVVTFGITVVLSIALVTVCRMILLQTRPATEQAQAMQIAARDKYREAENERIEIRDFLPKFEQLRARGFVGDEQRLDMLEAIEAIQEARRLLPISYEFAPQQPLAVDPAMLAPPLELRATRVTLHMGLLHELDLFHFLQDLKAKGFYTVKECTLTMVEVPADAPLAPRMTADCALYWLTIASAAALAPDAAPAQ